MVPCLQNARMLRPLDPIALLVAAVPLRTQSVPSTWVEEEMIINICFPQCHSLSPTLTLSFSGLEAPEDLEKGITCSQDAG